LENWVWKKIYFLSVALFLLSLPVKWDVGFTEDSFSTMETSLLFIGRSDIFEPHRIIKPIFPILGSVVSLVGLPYSCLLFVNLLISFVSINLIYKIALRLGLSNEASNLSALGFVLSRYFTISYGVLTSEAVGTLFMLSVIYNYLRGNDKNVAIGLFFSVLSKEVFLATLLPTIFLLYFIERKAALSKVVGRSLSLVFLSQALTYMRYNITYLSVWLGHSGKYSQKLGWQEVLRASVLLPFKIIGWHLSPLLLLSEGVDKRVYKMLLISSVFSVFFYLAYGRVTRRYFVVTLPFLCILFGSGMERLQKMLEVDLDFLILPYSLLSLLYLGFTQGYSLQSGIIQKNNIETVFVVIADSFFDALNNI
jgi:hypothetical protein